MLEAYNYRQCVDEVNQEQMSTVALRYTPALLHFAFAVHFAVRFCSSLLQFAFAVAQYQE